MEPISALSPTARGRLAAGAACLLLLATGAVAGQRPAQRLPRPKAPTISVAPQRAKPAPAPTAASSPRSPGGAPILLLPRLSSGRSFDYARLVRTWDIRAGAAGATYSAARSQGDRMVLCTSVPLVTDLATMASAGFTLVQTDSDHLGTEEREPGLWEFSGPDSALRMVKQAGLDWCYFPHFAFPPTWYNQAVKYDRSRCLEHDKTIEALSVWEPRLDRSIVRGYSNVGAHYRTRPVTTTANATAAVSAVYIGVHGDYGECGMPMGARTAVAGQREDWQRRFGNLHDHMGWWCAEPTARTAFRKQMLEKYQTLERLNMAWRTSYAVASQIAYPADPTHASRRWWLDFVDWYRGSITSLTARACAEARRAFPDAVRMIPCGFPNEDLRGGNDNSALARVAARTGTAVRSTHGAFRPFAESQASMLGRLASASRFYGAPFWTEPPSATTPDQQVERIFAAASLGSVGYFDWSANVRTGREVYYKYGKYLRCERPIVDVAMFYPSTYQALRPNAPAPQLFEQGCTAIRDILNYDIVDERMVVDGALDRYRVLVLWEGTVVEAAALAAIRNWVGRGGVVAAYDFGKIETVEGDGSWFRDVFGHASRLAPAAITTRYVSDDGSAPPSAMIVHPGEQEALPFLRGDWKPAEVLDGVARRWTGSSAEVVFPVAPGRDYELCVTAALPPEAAGKARRVLVNDHVVGQLAQTGAMAPRFAVPASMLAGRSTATVRLECDAWIPAQSLKGSSDTRPLGLWVSSVSLVAAGPSSAPITPNGRIETVIDLDSIRSRWARKIGKGWSVYFPARKEGMAGYLETVRYLTYHLSDLDPSKTDAIAVDNAWDGMYATLLSDKVLYYNSTNQPAIRTIVLSPSAFGSATGLATPASYTHELTVEPHALAAISFSPATELVLQCEKFTGLGGLEPAAGSAYSPGSGDTHVLVPSGKRISTRFQCQRADTYTVYYRCTRRGGPATARIAIDGVPVTPPQHPYQPAGSQTLCAGTVKLTAGVHDLLLEPRAGEDLRADLVVLSNDGTVGGYGFGVVDR